MDLNLDLYGLLPLEFLNLCSEGSAAPWFQQRDAFLGSFPKFPERLAKLDLQVHHFRGYFSTWAAQLMGGGVFIFACPTSFSRCHH